MTKINLRFALIFVLIAGISLGFYVYVSVVTYRLGFPLDDAWIHQTYARNLAQWHQWAYIPGKISAGSTAPLWSFILSLGYFLGVNPYLWTFCLSWFLLAGLALVGQLGFQVYSTKLSSINGSPAWGGGAGVLMCLEWHLVWAAGSGMETLLFSLVVTLIIVGLAAKWRNWFLLGIFIGASVWLRPDGLTILAPALLTLILRNSDRSRIINNIFLLLLGFSLLFLPYLLFNFLIAGNWWPNTFYAKQAEYSVLQAIPLWQRWFQQFGVMQVGVGILLLPGFIYLVWQAFSRKNVELMIGIIWVLVYLGLYAWRLPVVYQHGRYVIPVMPLFFLWGYCGLKFWLENKTRYRWRILLNRVWLISMIFVLLAFWIQGALSFGQDVAIIESEMVYTAIWVARNTDPGAVIAAHDIGAMGYFGQRKLIDLAGLISPEVIPFIRDENRLVNYLDQQKVEYLVTFPKWYPLMVQCATLVHQDGREFSLRQGGENMAVYQWKSGCIIPDSK